MTGLTPSQIAEVKSVLAESFGFQPEVWLFGSRAAGPSRGDVDLLVALPSAGPLTARLRARRRLEAALHQKVDLVVQVGDEPPTAFATLARETGIKL